MSKPSYSFHVAVVTDCERDTTPRQTKITVEASSFTLACRAAAHEAARQIAASQVDYDHYSSDSAYLEQIDSRRERMRIIEIVPLAPSAPYLIVGIYGDYPEGGTWCDTVAACSREDAAFQGAWQMALNSTPDEPHPTGVRETIDSFFEEIECNDIVYCEPVGLATTLGKLAFVPPGATGVQRLIATDSSDAAAAAPEYLAEATRLGVAFIALPA